METQGQTRDVVFTLAVEEHADAQAGFKSFADRYEAMYERVDKMHSASVDRRIKAELDALTKLSSAGKQSPGIDRISPAGPIARAGITPADTRASVNDLRDLRAAMAEVEKSSLSVRDNFKTAHVSAREWVAQLDRADSRIQSIERSFSRIAGLKLPTMPDIPGTPRGGPRPAREESPEEKAAKERLRTERARQAGLNPMTVAHDQFQALNDKQQEAVLQNQLRMRARAADAARKAREQEARDEERFLAQRAARWEKTEQEIFRTRESAADRMRSIDDRLSGQLVQVGAGASNLVRSFAIMGLAGEENSDKILKGLMKAQAGFDLLLGGTKIVLGIKKALDLYNAATEAGAKLKEADAKAASLAKEKAEAVAAALDKEARAADRAARSHDNLSKSRGQSSRAAETGSMGFMSGGFGRSGFGGGRRGRGGAKGAMLGMAAEYGLDYLSDQAGDGATGDALGFAANNSGDLMTAIGSRGGRMLATRGIRIAGRASPWVAAAAGAGAGIYYGGSAIRQSMTHGVGGGADYGSAADQIGTWVASGAAAVGRTTGIYGSGRGLADLNDDGGMLMSDTLRRLAEQRALAQKSGLDAFTTKAESTQAAERGKTLAQQQSEIRAREAEWKQGREQQGEQRLSQIRPFLEQRDSRLTAQAQFGTDRMVDLGMDRRRTMNQGMDNQIQQLTSAIKSLQAAGQGNSYTTRGLEQQLSELSKMRRGTHSTQLSEGLTRDLAQVNAGQRVATFQRAEAVGEYQQLTARRASGDKQVSDAEIRAAEERAQNAAEKLNSLAKTRYDLERRIAAEKRESQQAAIEGAQRELEIREQIIQRSRQTLEGAKERFGDLDPEEQKKAIDVAAKMRSERAQFEKTGLTSTQRERHEEFGKAFVGSMERLGSARKELTRLEKHKTILDEAPDRIKSLTAEAAELEKTDPEAAAAKRKELAAVRREYESAQQGNATTERLSELNEKLESKRKSTYSDPARKKAEIASTQKERDDLLKSRQQDRKKQADLKRERARLSGNKKSREKNAERIGEIDAELEQYKQQNDPDSRDIDEKIQSARSSLAEAEVEAYAMRGKAGQMAETRMQSQMRATQEAGFRMNYDERKRRGMPTTEAEDRKRDEIEGRAREAVAIGLSYEERRTAGSIGTEYEGDVARRGSRAAGERAGFNQNFGELSRTNTEAPAAREAARQQQQIKVDLGKEMNYQATLNVDTDEVSRTIANQLRPQIEMALQRITQNVQGEITRSNNGQESRQRVLRASQAGQ